ncbi:hypothetical protein M8J76_008434 [Diaphorina citri]|nr:hypothetical protein M8J75_010268 [Diaphorina citri]KAI5740916.1 hypothetical protein M8J76_008434 [Diaphorina citri]
MKFNACHIFSLLSFLLVTLVPLLSAALTTFGKTPNASGSSRPCNTDGDCYAIKYSSCARDPSTGRRLCLCADSKIPIGNSCDQIPTALHLPCEKDEQCILNAGCTLNVTTGLKMCTCRDNATEVGNVCNEVPLWYSSWLQTILTVLHYAPPQPGAPLVQDAPIFPGVPHFPPHDRAPFGAGNLPSFDRDGNEIDIKTLDDRSPKGPMGTKKGPRYILNRIRDRTNEIGGKV